MSVSTLMVGVTTLLPVAVSVLLQLPKMKAFFERIKPLWRNIIYGMIYGILTCLVIFFSTSRLFGHMDNASFVVDAPPVIAGLLFDFPAGIIAAVIGFICRYASVLWAGESLLRTAGAWGLVLSGLLATLVKKIFFKDDYKPNFIHAFFFAVLIEIFSYTLIFIFNLNNLYNVFRTIQKILIPALLCMTFSVALSVFFVGMINKEPIMLKPTLLVRSFEKYMLFSIIFAVILMLFFSTYISREISVEDFGMLLSSNIDDIQRETENTLNQNLEELTKIIGQDYQENHIDAQSLAEKFGVSEINIIRNNVNIESNHPENIGFNMLSGSQSKDFMDKVMAEGIYVQAYLPMAQFENIDKKYAGMILDDQTILQVGYDKEQFQESIQEHVQYAAKYRHIGSDGEILVYNANGIIIASRTHKENRPGYLFEKMKTDEIPILELQQNTFDGIEYTWMYNQSNDFYFVAMVPTSEVAFSGNLTSTLALFTGIILFSFIFALIYFLLKKLVIRELDQVNDGLGEVTQGNLNTVIDVRTTKEFIELSDDINQMIASLKGFIHDAETRYEKDLNYARMIQYSVLPHYDQFCKSRRDIQLYSSMDPAENVGGDFFDYYTLHDNRFVFCIADVSGKSIPAAMFMMRVKTLLRSSMEKYDDLATAFEETNRRICESNEAGLFVTVWMGVCDMRKGILRFVNAGHNPPLFCRYGESFQYLKTRPNLVVGGRAKIKYTVHTVDFKPGDRIFLYTDGVTEANNAAQELYGEKRLIATLNQNMLADAEEVPSIEDNCRIVHKALNDFVGEAKQFDDITMLGISCIYLQDGDSAILSGSKESTWHSQRFLDECNENHRIPSKTARYIQVCSDEIVSNIIKYGHAKTICINYRINNNAVILEYEDDGILYDPLRSETPDITLPAKERTIGGLGLFMVKKMASAVEYSEKDGWNNLKLVFDYIPEALPE